MKIGQEVTVKEDFEVGKIISGDVVKIKAGDKGFVNSKGLITHTTGAGRGIIIKSNEEVNGYDHRNISKIILRRLNGVFGLEGFAQDEDIDFSEMIDEIEDILMDIL